MEQFTKETVAVHISQHKINNEKPNKKNIS